MLGLVKQALAVILFTDIVGSVDLKRERGQEEAARLVARHDTLFGEAVGAREGGRVLKDTGDGFLATFERPSDAVMVALSFQAALREDEELDGAISSRIGVHLGEIGSVETEFEDEKMVGLAVDLAARLMGMAGGGQILLSRPVFDDARTVVRDHPGSSEETPLLEWLAHGPYLLQGLEAPMEVYEVGAVGLAPLHEPPDSAKARRAVRPGDEGTLGWRPASGREIPGREAWRLEEKLGEGGFGEVWAARHQATGGVHTFKFCFEAEQVRSLKRELTLFRLLQETLGERSDIARLFDVRLDEPPYFLEMEYTPAGDVTRWAETKGGIDKVPLGERLEMVAQVAEALAAAHSVGVLHKDVKPVNVLVAEGEGGQAKARLTDFGIGRLVHLDALEEANITQRGYTGGGPTKLGEETGSSGTRLYMAPELDAGDSPSVQSDIYSVGVLLYQMVVADFKRPLGIGWERDVGNPFLRDDILACVDGDPARRLASAAELAKRLRDLDGRAEAARQEALERQAADQALAEAAKARRARKVWMFAGVVGAVVVVLAAGVAWRERERAETEASLRTETEYALYLSTVRHASSTIAGGGYTAGEAALLGSNPALRGWEWGHLMRKAHPELIALRGHTAGVRTVQFDATGEHLLTGAKDNTARIWSVATGEQVRALRGHAAPVATARYQPGGDLILTASGDGTARLWDANSGKLLHVLQGHQGPLLAAAWSPDGNMAGTVSTDGTGRLWSPETGELLTTLAGHDLVQVASLAGFRPGVFAIAFSPDSTLVATGGADGTARVWGSQSGEEVALLRGHEGYVQSVHFSADGALLATSSMDGTARVWDLASKAEVAVMEGHRVEVYRAVFGPEGKRLLTAGDDGTARIWEVATGRQMAVLVGHSKWVEQAWWVGADTVLTASGDGTARLWEAATGMETARLSGHSYFLDDVALSPDGLFVATASADGTAKIWDASSGREAVLVKAHDLWLWEASWSPDSALVATASGDGTAKVWAADTGALVATIAGHDGEVRDASYSPDGKRLVTAGQDGTARAWDTDTWEETLLLDGHDSLVLAARYSPDGSRIATASGDGTLRIWNAESGASMLRRASGGVPVHDVAWRPDGEAVAVALADGSAQVWQAANGVEVARFPRHQGAVWAVAWSPGGEFLATGSDDGNARVWNVEAKEVVALMSGHFDVVRSVAWDPEGRRLATGSRDGTARVWDVRLGQQLLQLRDHDLWVRSVAFAPDGSALLTASGDSMFGIWRALPWSDEGEAKDWDAWLARWQIDNLNRWQEMEVVDRGPARATTRPQ